jgi:uncharacterized repeat protein (TIGR03943 family)
VLTVVDPGALGSYAVGQKGIYRAPPQEVDLGDMVAARSFNDQAVEVSLLDLWNGLGDEGNRRAVSEVRLRVKGLVVNEGGGEDGFLLARLVMGCCAADALPVAMMIRHDLQVTLPDDAWVVVEGVLDPEATARALADDESWPVLAGVMDLVSYELIDEPPDPYLYPW